jgi:hypothetical protein
VLGYLLVALVPIVALRQSGTIRLHRLQSLTRAASPALLEAIQQHPPSVLPLHIRGCTALGAHQTPTGLELQAECARGIGNWDQLVFRPDSQPTTYPEARTDRWGRWSYFWD